jgi:hypothetical protein
MKYYKMEAECQNVLSSSNYVIELQSRFVGKIYLQNAMKYCKIAANLVHINRMINYRTCIANSFHGSKNFVNAIAFYKKC